MGLFVWQHTPVHPFLKPTHRSILLTIQIVIDLPYLDPAPTLSYLTSVPYWKGKHSWCSKPKCPVPGCSFGAVCHVVPPWWMDGFLVHIYSGTSHLLISGWRLTVLMFMMKAGKPFLSWCILISTSSKSFDSGNIFIIVMSSSLWTPRCCVRSPCML